MDHLTVNRYKQEEFWNALSHAIGIPLSLAGGLSLYPLSMGLDATGRNAILVYSVCLLVLFSASSAYHAIRDPRIKRRLRILDHISIYYLIAGTYTPVALIALRDSSGWWFFGTVWGLAAFGTVLKLFFTGRFEVFSLLLYLIMGWCIVLDLGETLSRLGPEGSVWLAAGGACYTIGILFYVVRKIPFNHFIWHLFVLGGALSHWMMVRSLFPTFE